MFFQLIQTQDELLFNLVTLALRLALGLVILPHGLQKLLGWFGGYGYRGTMRYFTQTLHIPYLFGFLAIVAEVFGALGLLAGLLTRLSATGIAIVMLIAALKVHRGNGFFMNWFGTQDGEGYEFFILAIGMAVVIIVTGAGGWSLDQLLGAALL